MGLISISKKYHSTSINIREGRNQKYVIVSFLYSTWSGEILLEGDMLKTYTIRPMQPLKQENRGIAYVNKEDKMES